MIDWTGPYTLRITDSGWWSMGWWTKLPSGWCSVEIAVHYRGAK